MLLGVRIELAHSSLRARLKIHRLQLAVLNFHQLLPKCNASLCFVCRKTPCGHEHRVPQSHRLASELN